MKQLKHARVVQVKEVLASKAKIFIVMDYISGGDFRATITSKGQKTVLPLKLASNLSIWNHFFESSTGNQVANSVKTRRGNIFARWYKASITFTPRASVTVTWKYNSIHVLFDGCFCVCRRPRVRWILSLLCPQYSAGKLAARCRWQYQNIWFWWEWRLCNLFAPIVGVWTMLHFFLFCLYEGLSNFIGSSTRSKPSVSINNSKNTQTRLDRHAMPCIVCSLTCLCLIQQLLQTTCGTPFYVAPEVMPSMFVRHLAPRDLPLRKRRIGLFITARSS